MGWEEAVSTRFDLFFPGFSWRYWGQSRKTRGFEQSTSEIEAKFLVLETDLSVTAVYDMDKRFKYQREKIVENCLFFISKSKENTCVENRREISLL
jgi:hypothetical protein